MHQEGPGQKTRRSCAFPPPTLPWSPAILLTAPLSSNAVALPLSPCETLRRYRKLATSSWLKENRIGELIDYVDVINNPSWTNDAATIVIGVKNNLTSAVAMHIALKLGQLAVEAGANEFNYYKDQGRYVIRM